MSRLGRFIPGALALMLGSMVWATAVRAASISASPNPCTVAFGQTACTSIITWTATEVPQAQIWFTTDGGPESLFACGNVGTQNASWIQSGHTYGFTVYQSNDCAPATKGAALKSVSVSGTVALPTLTLPASVSATAGVAINVPVTVIGATSTRSSGLPPGLNLVTFLGTSIQGTPTTAGTYAATIFATNAGGTVSQNVTFTIVLPPPPAITSAGLASGTVGTAFSYQITATNGPTSFSAQGLPSGLSLNPGTGQILGTPTADGTSSVLLGAVNAGGSDTMTLNLTIQNIPPVITSPGFLNGIEGQYVFYQITATNHPLSYSAANLPPGFSLNPVNGAISGVVQAPGIWIATLGATNSAASAEQSLGITIRPPPPVILGPAVAAGKVGVPFSVQMQASNPGSWSATGLPPGLSINWIDGTLSGTPTTAGSFAASVQTASASGSASATLTVTILPAPLPIPPAITQQPVSMTISAGQTATFSVVATGTAPLTYQWSKNGTPISGATGAGYTTPATTLADNGAPFTVTVNNVTDLPVTSQAAILTVNSLPTVALPTLSPDGGGFTQSVSVALNCATAGAQIRYTTDNSPPTSASPLYASALTLTATTVLRVKAFHAGMNDSAETNVTFVMNESPSITQPPSNQIVSVGQTTVFAVTASGTAPLTYQWSKNGTPISGAAGASYTTPATTLADNGAQFSVVVNNVTNLAATSTPATLTVNPLPTVATPTFSPNGGSFTDSVLVTIACATPAVQIRYTTDGTAPTMASTLYLTAIPLTTQTTLRAKAFASGMNDSAEASALFVMDQRPSITQQPVSLGVIPGQTATFSVTATGAAPLTYQWSKNGTLISGAAGASYTTPATTLADNGAQFSVVVNNVTNLAATSTPVTLSVNPLPTVATPTLSPNGGSFTDPVHVTMTCATSGAQIRYTTDGSAPNAASTLYTTAITLTTQTTVRAMAFASGMNDSAEASALFIVTQHPLDAQLSMGTLTAAPGSLVVVHIMFAHGPTAIDGLQFDFALPAGITGASAATGPAAMAEGKSVSSAMNGTTLRVLLAGLNTNTFSDGVVVNLTLELSASASGTVPLHLSNLLGASLTGHAVTLTGVDGSIVVSGAAALATPALQVAAFFPVNGSMAVTYAGTTPVTFQWSITPLSAASETLAGPALAASGSGRSLSTDGPLLPLAPLALVPGRYLITVEAVDALGNHSNPAEARTTLVAPAFGAPHVFPNPWRADRPKDGIHFENLSDHSTVKIFTLSGRWVQTLSPSNGKVIWNLRNNSGDAVASGLYIYLVTDDQGGRARGTVAVVK